MDMDNSAIELIVEDIWKKMLNLEKIDSESNFFSVGGDSKKAISILSELKAQWSFISLPQIMKYHTIAEISAYIKQHLDASIDTINATEDDVSLLMNAIKQLQDYSPSVEYSKNYDKYLIESSNIQISRKENYKNIFITGATGFLGMHLVHEFLTSTNSDLYLLVRGKTPIECKRRLEKISDIYFPELKITNKYSGRIHYIPGDITARQLGMNDEDYLALSDNIDCVIHSAATVSHFDTWEKYQMININGTRNMLDFAAKIRKKDFCYISTISIGFTEKQVQKKDLFSEYSTSFNSKSNVLYSMSKIETEKMVLDMQQQGLSVKIFRPGFLVQSFETGQFQVNAEENALYKALSILCKFGTVPDVQLPVIDMTYVDQAAKAISKLCGINDNHNIYHVFNPNRISISDLFRYYSEFTDGLRICTVSAFEQILRENAEKYKEEIFELSIMMMLDTHVDPSVLCLSKNDRTVRCLETQGFVWEPVNKEFISNMVVVLNNIKNI